MTVQVIDENLDNLSDQRVKTNEVNQRVAVIDVVDVSGATSLEALQSRPTRQTTVCGSSYA